MDVKSMLYLNNYVIGVIGTDNCVTDLLDYFYMQVCLKWKERKKEVNSMMYLCNVVSILFKKKMI